MCPSVLNEPAIAAPAARPTFEPVSVEPIRLLLWAPNGAGLHYSGPGMSAYRLLSKRVPADCLDVTLAHGSPDQQIYPLFSDQALIAPVRSSPLSQIAFIWQGRRWLSEQGHRFDVFYGLQAFDFTVSPAMHAARMGLPAIVKVVQNHADLADRTGWRSLLGRAKSRRRQMALLSGIVSISDAITAELLSYGTPERKIARIPNGVDTDQFRPAADEESRKAARRHLGWADELTLLFVGAVVPRKRPHLLIEAIGALKSRGMRLHLVLAGPIKDTAYGMAMQKLATDLNVADQVTWQGFLDDTASAYQGADIFALPSANEGMPNALLEAIASGLPAVVTPIPGSTDLVCDGVEAIYVMPDAASLTDALATYIRSASLRQEHGRAARARALAMFSARHILERHMGLYRRVMNGQDAAEF